VAATLDWLVARPIAHRGLHDAAHGVIENTAAAVRAAIAGGYGIEVDLQISADGEAMVHHDDVLGRLTEGEGRLDRYSAAELKRIAFRGSDARMMTLGELCDLIAGRATLLVELKSRFDGDPRLPARVAAVLAGYRADPVAPMSFDPMQLAVLRHKSPSLPRGIVAAQYRPHPYWDQMPAWLRYGMGSLLPAFIARPHFVAYAVGDLPALAPWFARHVLCLPLLTWAVRTEAERQRAARFADQMIFEGFRP
jgi:glycerophosphoryl diester phosphodiesterase